ncbi:unnamed protein product [Oikopleura dioica]|uniref:F5/8 type C domain-containing protein n=1 Tax=Oikopleura dioica TaxID=34765 RepID=E4YCW3_OIKDI|nr:unnamed protein product [Oikopleura dioica]
MQSSCAKACGFCKPKPACIWNSWMTWTSCSRSCGTGAQTRSRKMIGSGCIGSPIETRQCNMQNCPTPPPTTTRPAATPANKYQGECKDEETWCSGIAQSQCRSSIQIAARCRKSCGLCIAAISAPTVGGGEWQPWSPWTACSGSCKGGFSKSRERRCGEYGRKCDGKSSETSPCSIGFDCYVDEYFKCSDKSDNCNEYALEGRCFDSQFKDWMSNNCEASCRLCMGLNIQWSEWTSCKVPGGVCGNGERKRSHDVTTIVETCNIPCASKASSTKADCKDKHPYCPNLTSHCESKSVQSACQFTCNSCPADIPVDNTCKDKNDYVCSQSANCQKEEFQYLCLKTCKTCMKAASQSVDNSSVSASNSASNCKDLSPACKGAGIKAQCSNNLWLKKNCRETCETCGVSEEAMTTRAPLTTMSPVCIDKSRDCPRWKSMCQSQREILEVKCPVTCGICVPETTKAPITTTTTTKVATSPKTMNCMDGPLCSHYAGNWEINCRDSAEFRDTCPTLCKIDICAEYWDEDLIPENTDELEKRWRAWQEWGACSVSCGGGERSRSRTCNAPVYKPCTYGSESDTGLCNKMSCCPKMCDNCQPYFGEWAEWSTCTATCRGSGARSRSRECIQVNEDKPGACEGDASENDDCPNLDICYDEWTKWTDCDADCGNNSTQTRQRVCNEPEDCEWVDKESQECAGSCVFDDWSEWSDCSVTCGNATATRSRDCPVEGACGEESIETMDCEVLPCAEYLDWSEWSECSVSCGGGEMRRERNCTEVDECSSLGAPSAIMACNEEGCPVVVEWGEWTAYSPCSESAECGQGHRERVRGEDVETINCYAGLCSDVGAWTEWAITENNCEITCGGYKLRERQCINGIPEQGGCQGDATETIECEPCGEWNVWTSWSDCNKSCHTDGVKGIRSRSRKCMGGRCKAGDAEEIISCCDFKPTLRTTTEWETTSSTTGTTNNPTTTTPSQVTSTVAFTISKADTTTAEITETPVLEAELDRLFDSFVFGEPSDCNIAELSEEPNRILSSSNRESFEAEKAMSEEGGWCASLESSDNWLVIDYAEDITFVGVKFNIVEEVINNGGFMGTETQSMRHMASEVKVEYNQDGQWTPIQSIDTAVLTAFEERHLSDPFGNPSVDRLWTKKIKTDRIRLSVVATFGRNECLNVRILTCAPAIQVSFGLPPFASLPSGNPFLSNVIDEEDVFSLNDQNDFQRIEIDGSGDF